MSDYVSDDLINEIFERLPSKSLLRFRSLSKSWCSRIQSPDFIHRHALRSKKKTPKILIRHSIMYDTEYIDMYTLHSEDQFVSSNPEWLNVRIPALKFPTSTDNTPIGEIMGSCNGILCLFHKINNTISLWNPSIRRVTTLPPAPNHPVFASLVGFGFDTSIDDYKIVRISHKWTFVYTLKTRVWCPIASPNPEFGYPESCACFFNGALHWTVTDHIYHNNGKSHHILTFDLATHVFGKIALPNPYWLARELTIINSSLAVIPDRDNRIWILKEDNNVPFWSDAYKLGQSGRSFYSSQGMKSSLQLTTNGNILLNIRLWDTRTYAVYNTRTGKWDPSMMMYFHYSKHKHMEKYVESLELMTDTKQGLKKINETDEMAIHNVTLRKSEMSLFYYLVQLFWFSIRSCILPS